MSVHSRTKSSTLRVSSYRHVFGETAKDTNRYEDVKNPLTAGEGSYCKANSKFFAVPIKGAGGPVYIIRHQDVGRVPATVPLLSVHKGKCWDFDFHPFIDNMIATVSDDCKVAVTTFPIDGLKETITEPTVLLEGHSKKTTSCEFHPTANNILATGGFDRTVKIWNIESAANVATFDEFEDTLYSMGWNYDGSLLGVSSKDKKLRLFDPRQKSVSQTIVAFDGAQSSKLFWVQKFGWIGVTGFSKSAKRQLKLFDLRNSNESVLSNDVDQTAGVILPHWDNDNGMLYLVGKGEGNINYFELDNDDKILHTLGAYRSAVPQKGGGWIPKKAMDVWKCEVARFLKLTQSSVIPISFFVPRKAGAEVFQKDIFPDAYGHVPSLSAEEWISGQNKDPVLISMDPKNNDSKKNNTAAQFSKKLNLEDAANEIEKLKGKNSHLTRQNEELRARVRELEKQLGITSSEIAKEEEPATEEKEETEPEEPQTEEQTNEETIHEEPTNEEQPTNEEPRENSQDDNDNEKE